MEDGPIDVCWGGEGVPIAGRGSPGGVPPPGRMAASLANQGIMAKLRGLKDKVWQDFYSPILCFFPWGTNSITVTFLVSFHFHSCPPLTFYQYY